VEQLLAESTGKEGKGLVPVEGEPLGAPAVYGADRVFAAVGPLEPASGASPDKTARLLRALESAGYAVDRLHAEQPADLGYQFFVWEFATAVAGALMGIDAFDQPNVQESKDNTNRVLAEFEAIGRLPAVDEAPAGQELAALDRLLARARPGDYIALMAYLPRTPEIESALQHTRTHLRDRLRLATTVGYGPRFLHSTGQLHKGGPNTGVFVQLVADDAEDAPVPDAPYSFSVLKAAQAIGDLQALQAHGRRVLRLRLRGALPAAIRRLAHQAGTHGS
jgi:hypothetical protein